MFQTKGKRLHVGYAKSICKRFTVQKVSKNGVFSGPYFLLFGLNTGDLLGKSPYSVQIKEKTDHKKLRIWTLLM